MNYNAICDLCGKFMSYRQMRYGVSWTPFGNSTDTEPPDDCFAHKKCWNNATDEQHDLIKRISYVGPIVHSQPKIATGGEGGK